MISSPDSKTHPEHDAIGRVVHGWYNSSVPQIGLVGAAHWFGFACMMGADRARVVLTIDDPAEVPSALTAAKAISDASSTMVMVDDRDRAARLDAALRENGCSHDESTTYLALAGPIRSPAPGPDRLEIRSISEAELETWARVKLQAFADSEDPPADDAITAEAAQRSSELPLADYQLGSLDGEPRINRDKAEQLIAIGRMRPPGLAEVERARADGRWDNAYEGARTAAIPGDLQRELDTDPIAAAAFAGLDSRNHYAIIWRLNDAKRPETRARRLADYLGMLHRGERLHE